jgi:hypothetical protein
MNREIHINSSLLRDIAIYLVTGLVVALALVSLKNGGLIFRAEANSPSLENENNLIQEGNVKAVNIDLDNVEYIENEFISYCDDTFLEKYEFKEALVIGDRLSNFIFPREAMVEYNCV